MWFSDKFILNSVSDSVPVIRPLASALSFIAAAHPAESQGVEETFNGVLQAA